MKIWILASCLLLRTSLASFDFLHRTNDFATHQPVLYEIVKKTTGPIIEFGCGRGSTELLHEMCKSEKRMLISVDDDHHWLNEYSKLYLGDGYEMDNSGWHKFYFVSGKSSSDRESPEHWIRFFETFDIFNDTYFDVVFIDQSPWLARSETLKRVKGKAKYVIIHDFDYFLEKNIFGKIIKPVKNYTDPGIFDLSDVFQYSKVYYPLKPWQVHSGPPTLLGSDIDPDLPDIDFEQY